jgi:hypothetical protein
MSAIIEQTFEALLFGSTWYFGILIFIIMAVALMKMWKYAGALIVPLIMALEIAYFERLDETGNFIWPMLILLFLAFGVAVYSVMSIKKND